MVRTVSLLMAAWFVALTGCESVSERFQERLAPPQPQVRSYPYDQETVFGAARSALRTIDFQVGKSGVAQGILTGYSRIRGGDSFGDARQYTLDIRVRSFSPGETEVAVVLRQQDETSAFAGATDIAVREHGLYDSYFAAIELALRNITRADAARESQQ